MQRFVSLLFFFLCANLEWSMAAEQPEIRSTLADQHSVAVTLYNADLALIKDRRQLTLPPGRSTVAWRDVSAQIHPETALLRTLDAHPPVRVVEQNFDFDLLTPSKLLEKYVGREVGFVTAHPTTGEETEEPATVLAAQEGVVLRLGDRIETGAPGSLWGRIVYRDLPANLRDRPTLTLTLDNAAATLRTLELSYLTGGLTWRADYVGELNAAADRLDLTGWVTLDNRSGASYHAAQLQLVAGAVHRAPPEERDFARPMAPPAPRAAMSSAMEEESLFEYHLYTVADPTTLADRQSKQVALLAAPQVKVRKEWLVAGARGYGEARLGELAEKLPVTVWLELVNDEASQLGLTLPAGVVRIYQRDARDNAQFIGEDRIAHTPKNAVLRLKLGEAFDVTAERKQTDFKKLSGSGPWQYQYESAFAIVLRNAKSEALEVRVQESLPGDWTLLEESHPHTKDSANTATWRIAIAPESATTLTYRARVRW